MVTIISLVTGEYAILSINSSSTTSLSMPGGLYMTTISNTSDISNQVLLYQINLPNVSFLGLYCDLAPNKIGYMCIIETSYISQTLQTSYMKIQFLTSESVTSNDLLSNLPPNLSSLGIMSQGIGMQAMVFGGYMFYAMAKNQDYYIWTYNESSYNMQLGPYQEAAIYMARLTPDATNRFKSLADSNKTEYFKILLQDMAKKLPIRPELLSVNDGYQYISDHFIDSLQFAIRVNKTNSRLDNNNTVPGIVSDIKDMIRNKKITTFNDGITNDLDDSYGFKPKGDIFGDYKDKIIPFLSIAAVNTFLYISSRSNNEMPEGLTQVINTASAGLFSASHTTFSSIFSFSDVNNYPGFSITSKILWITPIGINIVMFTYIMYRKGLRKMSTMNFITIGLTLYNSETYLLVNKAQIESLFGEEFEATAKWRAIIDVIFKSIPQLVTQILYFKLIVTYSIIPFFTLCTTIFMIALSAIKTILNIITHGPDKKKPVEKTDVENKDVTPVGNGGEKGVNDQE
ncbi:7823_t:CDS:2 [Gigaspora margarita]|uniref:7823_t:CDS:1 n=1 Tax=Gigaspora margarita TaxID=4874 RepID=A0ABN7VIG3_GIGMA|nr:7823_t:CDS:2 [Gigaspora margarita]